MPAGNGAAPFDIRSDDDAARRLDGAGVGARSRRAVRRLDAGGRAARQPSARGRGRAARAGRRPAARPRQSVLVSGVTDPQGLAFDTLDGRPVLYVAESGRLTRYAWNGTDGAGERYLVGGELPDRDGIDRRKGIAIGSDHTIYVSVGSGSAEPGPRGVVLAFRPGGAQLMFATGVRNGPGLSIDPDGVLWAGTNAGRDDAPDGLARLTAGRHVSKVDRPIAAHSAPLGFHFLAGSKLPSTWKRRRSGRRPRFARPRRPRTGGALASVDGREAREAADARRAASSSQTGRGGVGPSTRFPGPDGALYVTDDTAGAVYRLVPPLRNQARAGTRRTRPTGRRSFARGLVTGRPRWISATNSSSSGEPDRGAALRATRAASASASTRRGRGRARRAGRCRRRTRSRARPRGSGARRRSASRSRRRASARGRASRASFGAAGRDEPLEASPARARGSATARSGGGSAPSGRARAAPRRLAGGTGSAP